ncbi:MarR family winged helix-turn-helix transcriptional regulator [Levilactobacillus bambusae]|uniref:HTH marR-type domain-containing protein n=1 Tax=Levilactobacillus bambusae TaxID=2024736 RepID=A0A2V1N1I2_9LACO|nr:MarR family transcriptional regulator [Levilactobacillus bambusae]PWG00245.1 hypothetical protein DCM90_04735 [Levilactobacillus bambusae]
METTEAQIQQRLVQLKSSETQSDERKWMLDHAVSKRMQAQLNRLSALALSVIAEVADHPAENASAIAQSLNVTRGGISRIAKRLLADQLISTVQREGNRKERNYVLTDWGQDVANLHHRMHQALAAHQTKLFAEFTPQELTTINRFLKLALEN